PLACLAHTITLLAVARYNTQHTHTHNQQYGDPYAQSFYLKQHSIITELGKIYYPCHPMHIHTGNAFKNKKK
ncbi:MAG TPA: hypothetical protein PL009_14055, partial [Flavipsychrobacter sp.]|nr:hypothetical protein [Flavipsychrobacter sp.]